MDRIATIFCIDQISIIIETIKCKIGTQKKCVNSSLIENSKLTKEKEGDDQKKNMKYWKMIKCYDHPCLELRT